LVITWDEIADRINIHESYLNKYPDSIRKEEMQRYLLYYMKAYLFGLDNSSVFDYESDKFKGEVLQSYQKSIKAYPDTELAGILSEYTGLLEKNNYKLTEEVGTFQTELWDTLRQKLDNKIYRYYGIVIESRRAEHEKHDIIYPVVKGMEDEKLQEKINQRLFESVNLLLADETEEEYNSTNWNDYQVQRLDEDVLSITFDVYSYIEGAVHPNYALISTNINMKTGEEYSLAQLFAAGYDYKQDLFQKAKKQIEELDFPLLDDFKGIEDKQEFYMTSDGLVIYYQPYVYTPYAYGPLELYFDYDELSQLIIPN